MINKYWITRLKKSVVPILAVLITAVAFSSCSSDESVNTHQNNDGYAETEDAQNFLSSYSAIAKAGDGYYFITDSQLMFLDPQTMQAYPVCSKANCEHDNSDCTAFLSPFEFSPVQLIYYNNSLYLIGWENNGASARSNYLYCISLDNFKRKKLVHICDTNGSIGIAVTIHRGYVYYYYGGFSMDENTLSLYRTKLNESFNKSDPELVYQYTAIGASFVGFNAYSNNLFIGVSAYADELGNGYNSALYSVDINSLEAEKIFDSYPYSYFPDSDYLYYGKDEGSVNRLDLVSQEEKLFCQTNGACYISCDSNYIYFDNLQSVYIEKTEEKDRKILVYDKSGEYVTEIVPKNPKDECYFGGDDLMIFKEAPAGEAVVADGAKGYYVLDKSQLTKPEKEFIDME